MELCQTLWLLWKRGSSFNDQDPWGPRVLQVAQQLDRSGLRAARPRLHAAQPPPATLKREHPSCLAVVCPAVLPFPQQEALSSWPLPHSPCLPLPGPGTGSFLPLASGPGPPGAEHRAGTAPRSGRPECTPLLCAVSSLGQGAGVGTEADWEQHTGVLGGGWAGRAGSPMS